ncbi:MAG: hypothetical protein WD076_12325, partial [Parvularculaceae bacterium]
NRQSNRLTPMTRPARIMIGVLAAALFLAGLARAETPAIFAALDGAWAAEGKAFGADARSFMTWTPVLGGKFFRVDYRIEMTRADGVAAFEGVGHYQIESAETARGFWADSSGDLHPIAAAISPDAIVSNWGAAGGKQGRTEYRLKDGGVLVTDWILTPEGWKQFNQATFRKAD